MFVGESGAISKGNVFPAHCRKVPFGRIIEVVQREKRCHDGKDSPRERPPKGARQSSLYMPQNIYKSPQKRNGAGEEGYEVGCILFREGDMMGQNISISTQSFSGSENTV